jgi:hypothetical protein
MVETPDHLVARIIEDRIERLQARIDQTIDVETLRAVPALAVFRNQVLPDLLRTAPWITRDLLLDLLKLGWPQGRGRGAALTYEPSLVAAAHDALIRESPLSRNSKTACAILAERLFTDIRTIQRYIARARRQK